MPLLDCKHNRSNTLHTYTHQSTFTLRVTYPQPQTVPLQITSDSKYNLLNVVARWPGEAHDSFVLQNSTVGTRLAQGPMEMAVLLVSDLSDC